jgi:hypothetical protein
MYKAAELTPAWGINGIAVPAYMSRVSVPIFDAQQFSFN